MLTEAITSCKWLESAVVCSSLEGSLRPGFAAASQQARLGDEKVYLVGAKGQGFKRMIVVEQAV